MSRFLLIAALMFGVVVFAGTRPDSKATPVHAAVNTFLFTGGEQTYVVPAGVTRIQIEAVGAVGGTGGDVACGLATGGVAGYVLATGVPVTPGATLFVNVGGVGTPAQSGGTGGFNGGGNGGLAGIAVPPRPGGAGGGGGGASDVRTISRANAGTLNSRVQGAGGGGGGGGCGLPGVADNGGAGGLSADLGSNGLPAQNPFGGQGGGGGTKVAGGAAGTGDNSGALPTIGTQGQGGVGAVAAGGPPGGSGGGGGGGLFGGGGGGSGFGDNPDGGGGGGGGGSNLTPAAATSIITSNNLTGNPAPRVIITTADAGPFTKAFSPAIIQVNGASTLTFSLSNLSPAPLTGVAFTDDMTSIAVTITGAATNTCGGTLSAVIGTSLISLTGGTIVANGNCTIAVPVTSATTGTKVNTSSLMTSNEAAPVGPAVFTLQVNPAPVVATNTPVPPTLTPTPVPVVVQPVIPQVFQHVPQGIFNGTRNNTPTPVRQAVAPVVANPSAVVAPVLRPPSTGDAGLLKALQPPSLW